jgi:putative Mg2+ transporter-C (MgtC) family protein
LELTARLALAAVFGAAIGLEREYRQKAAGLRTNMLISLGAALFTILSVEMLPQGTGDPSRIAANIVTGVGFLGGGAILRTGTSVHGLTTAATIWVNAAIGLAAGAGRYWLATSATLIALVILWLLPRIEAYVERRSGSGLTGPRV